MDLFKAALNSSQFRNQGFSNYNATSPEQKLREQLFHCTYNDDTKFVIQKAVKQVLHVYPYFQTEILEFVENGQQKRFLEIKGIMEITVRGKVCKVDYNMMLPNSFPKKPPYVRIINRNSEYMVDHHYKNLRSPTDPKSFILNEKLTSVKGWSENSSIVGIIMESNNMMRENFPFYKPNKGMQQNSSISTGWSSLNSPKNEAWSQNNNQYGNYNQGGFNQGFSNFNNQGFSNQGFSNQGFNNQGFNQGFSNNNNNNFGGFSGNPTPPIPFNNVNVNQAIVNSQKFVGQSKKIIQKMKTQHIKAVQKIQHLETIKFSLESQEGYLRNQNNRMFDFLKKNEKSDFRNLTQLIKPKDERSDQILDLTSSIKAKEDCISLLQERFSSDQISFQQFIKIVKKIEEQKFQFKVILTKCIQS